ncbi:hypothetical protein Tco_1028843 [Tanacetum coccineum]|uniref:Uncharacterized protein n=1 Tax=Tanacetum coccineum TaxID=301880 RepID=A0ABQ5G1S4_9ASTR
MMILLRLCIWEYAVITCCWNANVIVNSDVGGAAWHHACSLVVFVMALSIPVASWHSEIVFAAMAGFTISRVLAGHHLIVFAATPDLGGAAWHRACSQVVLDAALSIPVAAYLGVAARHRACSHAVLCEVDETGKTHRQ